VTKLSDAYRKLADAYLETADAIDEAVGDDLPDIPETTQAPKLQALPAQQKPQVYAAPAPAAEAVAVGVATTCPIHNLEYRSGNYGPFCPARGDDPAFTNSRGYCTMPGKNAANALAWLDIQAKARS
jgi:hypothetical protein